MALSERDRRIAIIGGGVAGALLVVFLLFNIVGGGPGPSPGPVISGPTIPPTTSPSPTINPSPIVRFGGRDPFSIPPTLSPTTATPSGSPSSSPSHSPSSRSSAQRSSAVVGGHAVTLLDIFTQGGVQEVQVTVDTSTYVRAAGRPFAGSFEMRSISGNCGNFVYGEQPFTLCVNPQR